MTPPESTPKRMCPNESCEKHGQPTKLMGGCDCGTKLVPYRTLDERVSDALWEIGSPGLKRMVGPLKFAEIERRRSRG